MHSKFNCIPVKHNGTRQIIYIILEVPQKFIIQIHFSLYKYISLFLLQNNYNTHGNRNILRDAKQVQQIEYLIQFFLKHKVDTENRIVFCIMKF